MAWTGDESSFEAFIDRHQLTFPQLSDDRGAVYAHFGIPTQPALVLVDATGEVTTLFGAVDADSLDAALTGLITP